MSTAYRVYLIAAQIRSGETASVYIWRTPRGDARHYETTAKHAQQLMAALPPLGSIEVWPWHQGGWGWRWMLPKTSSGRFSLAEKPQCASALPYCGLVAWQCPRCERYFCPACWSEEDGGLCTRCAIEKDPSWAANFDEPGFPYAGR